MKDLEDLISFIHCDDCVTECGLCSDCLRGLINRFCHVCDGILKFSSELDEGAEVLLFDLMTLYIDDDSSCSTKARCRGLCTQAKARAVQLMDVLLQFYYSIKPQDRIHGDFKKTLEENMKRAEQFKRGAPLFLKINEFARYFFFFELVFLDYTDYYYGYSQCFIILNLWRNYTENRISKKIASFTEVYDMDEQSLKYLLKKIERFKHLYEKGVQDDSAS